jgi:uridine kinase
MVRNLDQLVTCLKNISQNIQRFIIVIDGPGGSGKSFLAKKLCVLLEDCEIVHFDDFYLPHSDSEIIGSNFDWRRLIDQVLLPVTKHSNSKYQIYNWVTNTLDDWKETGNTKFVIVEGVTSGRLELREFLNFIIFIESPPEINLIHGIERDGIGMKDKWLNDWIPRELKYFNSEIHATKAASDLVVDGTYESSGMDCIKTIYESSIFSQT